AGTAGTCAALAAAEAGAKTLIVEKTKATGGLSSVSGVIAATESAMQKEAGYDISNDELIKAFRSRSQNTCHLPLVRNIFERSADTIDWLQANGLGVMLMPPAGISQGMLSENETFTAHVMLGATNKTQGENPATKDVNFTGLYNTYFDKHKGEILLNTTVFKLLTDESGTVTGVAVDKEDGTEGIINAKKVILAMGAWNADSAEFNEMINTDWVKQYAPESTNDGTGISIATEIGAQRWGVTPQFHNCWICTLDGEEDYSLRFTEFTLLLRAPYNMWVNTAGARFADEAITGDFIEWANVSYSQAGCYYIILDQAEIDDLEANGTPVETISVYTPEPIKGGNAELVNAFGMKSGPLTGLQKILDEYIELGVVAKADSLEALAKQINLDPKIFADNVSRYNDKIAAQQDNEFYKDPKYLLYPLKQGPFYAMRTCTNSEGGMLGGVRVNENLEVLNKETGHKIENLYAVGTNAGGFYGTTGAAHYQGCSMSFAVNSGRIAGELATKAL
ncbi:MAG: FAD-dependent oxidoreductase, partial [Raoultibacter sp.]